MKISEIEIIAKTASEAFGKWSVLGPNERRLRLLRAAELLKARADTITKIMIDEIGCTGNWADFNVHLATQILHEAAALTTQVTGEVIPSDIPDCLSMAIREPAGVVLGIAPWNAPIILGIRAIAIPLACGNTVILKASEKCPATHQFIGEIFSEAGFAKGVVNVVINDIKDAPTVVETLISHPAIRRVNFTGSTEIGRIVAQIAAKYLKPILLELGGKSPMLILDDADLNTAVDAAVFAAFANQGQICMSTELILIDEKIADEFIYLFVKKTKTLSYGNPEISNVVLGAVVDFEAVSRVKQLVEDAIEKGAKNLTEIVITGKVISPIILDYVTPEMQIFVKESFGPVVSLTRFKHPDEAVNLANKTQYGLAASVFGNNIVRCYEIAKRIQSGICHINSSTVHDEAHTPFGGVKGSGYGRFGGKASINEFTDIRWITIQLGNRNYPF